MAGVDKKTRYQGVYARHGLHCAVSEGKRCNCTPSYYGVVWDQEVGKHLKTKRQSELNAARNARADWRETVQKGTLPTRSALRLGEARAKFVQAAREGVALNKWGRRYRKRAVEDLDSALAHLPERLERRHLDEVKRGEVQALVDALSANSMSGSRVRSVVNALRSSIDGAGS